jgi:hypothetical protein
MTTTGPHALSEVYDTYKEKDQIYLIPAKLVSPYDVAESKLIRQGYESKEYVKRLEEAYSVHYFFGDWVYRK